MLKDNFKRILFLLLTFAYLFISCSSNKVAVGGWVENGDSIVNILVQDSLYIFHLDSNKYFSGDIELSKGSYAQFSPNSLNLYLSPGEDLEIYVNMLNFSSSLSFRGSLGSINNYLKEQEVAVFFDKNYYNLGEKKFVAQMKNLTDEKIALLEAKNFGYSFTDLEKNRIRYSIASQAALYPTYRKSTKENKNYKPHKLFNSFLKSFSLNEEQLINTRVYQDFLFNYLRLKGNGFPPSVLKLVLSNVKNTKIRDFLLTQIVYKLVLDNNGPEGLSDLLYTFKSNCTNKDNINYIDKFINKWKDIAPAYKAPYFQLKDVNGHLVKLTDYKGSYLYITVWATWCIPCKKELPYLNILANVYKNNNIKFLTVSEDGDTQVDKWKSFLKRNVVVGDHVITDIKDNFSLNYLIYSVPRFILIDPEGRIVSANAPRPSGSIINFLNELFENKNTIEH